jgi:hypothetical protein
MKIQFPVRWTDKKKLDKDEKLTRNALIEDPEDLEGPVEYSYGSLVLDTEDIRGYNDIDENHCVIRTYQGDSFCVAIRIEELKSILVELTGENITIISRVPPKSEKKPKRKKDNDNDIII